MDISDSIHPVAREVYKLATCPSQYPQWTQLPTNYETVQHCNKHRRNCRFLHLSSGKAIRAKLHGKTIDTFANLQKRQLDGNVQGWRSTDIVRPAKSRLRGSLATTICLSTASSCRGAAFRCLQLLLHLLLHLPTRETTLFKYSPMGIAGPLGHVGHTTDQPVFRLVMVSYLSKYEPLPMNDKR
jgi:hypothetical protein